MVSPEYAPEIVSVPSGAAEELQEPWPLDNVAVHSGVDPVVRVTEPGRGGYPGGSRRHGRRIGDRGPQTRRVGRGGDRCLSRRRVQDEARRPGRSREIRVAGIGTRNRVRAGRGGGGGAARTAAVRQRRRAQRRRPRREGDRAGRGGHPWRWSSRSPNR